jgi:hypothetical protein
MNRRGPEYPPHPDRFSRFPLGSLRYPRIQPCSGPGRGCLYREKKPVSGSDCRIHAPENPVKRPDLGVIRESSIWGFFEKMPPYCPPILTPKIWVSFGFGHTWSLSRGHLPRKGPWRPSNAGVKIGRFFGPGLPGKRGFKGGFPRRRVVSRDGGFR